MIKSVLSGLLVMISLAVYSQQVKIVFDVTSSDTKVHEMTMRHVMGMAKAYPDSQFEVVVYSGALPMMLKDESTVRKEIEEFAAYKNVSFNVCAVTLKRRNLEESSLITGVGTVPDGILEIIQRQNEGWGYIKEAN
jgi:intracellular sulfur oxidation DsrE/DsrF family protein